MSAASSSSSAAPFSHASRRGRSYERFRFAERQPVGEGELPHNYLRESEETQGRRDYRQDLNRIISVEPSPRASLRRVVYEVDTSEASRMRGSKSSRSVVISERDIGLMIDQGVERRMKELARRSITPAISNAGSGRNHFTSTSEKIIIHQNKRDNKWEASDGEWKSLQIEDIWPLSWPVYSWPKIWGAEAITLFIRSLRALHRLQEKYNHLLHKAIVGLYDRLVSAKRTITPREWELLTLSKRVTSDSELNQSCWEICAKGHLAIDPNFPDHARVCRTFPANQVASCKEWMEAINGGIIPDDSTGHARVKGEVMRLTWKGN